MSQKPNVKLHCHEKVPQTCPRLINFEWEKGKDAVKWHHLFGQKMPGTSVPHRVDGSKGSTVRYAAGAVV
jgi:hypothetical protein